MSGWQAVTCDFLIKFVEAGSSNTCAIDQSGSHAIGPLHPRSNARLRLPFLFATLHSIPAE